jgi:FXSXX-COOH protein
MRSRSSKPEGPGVRARHDVTRPGDGAVTWRQYIDRCRLANTHRREVAALAGEEWESDMVDVSELSLTELTRLTKEDDDSPLARALRRVAADLADPDEPIAGFNSAL